MRLVLYLSRVEVKGQTCGPLPFSSIAAPFLPVLLSLEVLSETLLFFSQDFLLVDNDHVVSFSKRKVRALGCLLVAAGSTRKLEQQNAKTDKE